MSTDNIQAFYAKAQSSSELQARLAEIQRKTATSLAETLSRLASENGTPFSAADFLAHLNAQDEISDEELSSLAGGNRDIVTSPIVSKEKVSNIWTLWGRIDKYTYTSEDGHSSTRWENLNIGDPLSRKVR